MNNTQPPSLGSKDPAGCPAPPGECETGYFVALSEEIPGWTRGEESAELARLSFQQGTDAVIVEIGSLLGSGTILLAGAASATQARCIASICSTSDP
jgi:hypothetical protein